MPRGPKRFADTEAREFQGITYRRRPGKKYFETMRWDKKNKRSYCESLHQAVWKAHHGEVPAKHHIHHKDENKDNNDISNLECLTQSQHYRKHSDKWKTDKHRELLARIRPKALQASNKRWKAAPYLEYICCRCGQSFQSRCVDRNLPKYCTPRCRDQASRDRKSSAGL